MSKGLVTESHALHLTQDYWKICVQRSGKGRLGQVIEGTDAQAKEFTFHLWVMGTMNIFEGYCIRKINLTIMSHRLLHGGGGDEGVQNRWEVKRCGLQRCQRTWKMSMNPVHLC